MKRVRSKSGSSDSETQEPPTKKDKAEETSQPSEVPQLSIPTKRTLKFFYDGMLQQLSVYPGTPSSEIQSTILALLKIKPEIAHTAKFLDDSGIPLVLSSFMPEG